MSSNRRAVYAIGVMAVVAFTVFYTFYASATVIFPSGDVPGAGVRVAITMAIVVGTQLALLAEDRLISNRRLTAVVSIALMGLGSALLPVWGHWPGQILIGMGFGIVVVVGTSWTKESASPEELGKALGIYGFSSSTGGALGAPLGLFMAENFGMTGVAVAGAAASVLAIGAALVVPVVAPVNHAATAAAPLPVTGSVPVVVAETPADTGKRVSGGAITGWLFLAGHLTVVTLYATVLSNLPEILPPETMCGISVAVLGALLIQAALAVGRLVGGSLSDRWSASGTVLSGLGVVGVSVVFLVIGDHVIAVLILATVVGLASGATQSGALTALMQRAHNTRAINHASIWWNVGFDAGLGLGALAAEAVR